MKSSTVMLLVGVALGLIFPPLKLLAVGCVVALIIQNPVITVLLLLGLYKVRS